MSSDGKTRKNRKPKDILGMVSQKAAIAAVAVEMAAVREMVENIHTTFAALAKMAGMEIDLG